MLGSANTAHAFPLPRTWDAWVIEAWDPHRLAEFWSGVLGYVVEDVSGHIWWLLDGGAISQREVTVRDGQLCFTDACAIRHPDDPVDAVTGIGLGRRVVFLSGEPANEELQFAVVAADGHFAVTVDRVCALGAAVERGLDDDDGVSMTDPEGNRFQLWPAWLAQRGER